MFPVIQGFPIFRYYYIFEFVPKQTPHPPLESNFIIDAQIYYFIRGVKV
jgi:hypothetical protein